MKYNILPRLYLEALFSQYKQITLNKQQAHYLLNVMRLQDGSIIRVFNGTQGEWRAKLIKATNIMIELEEIIRPQEETLDIWLLFSPLKNHRTDFILEKATELGVMRFIPIIFERSIVKDLNMTRARMHLIEAAEQCERLTLPSIDVPCKLSSLIQNWPTDRKLLFMNENEPHNSIKKIERQKLAIMVGPEGGFTTNEVNLVSQWAISIHLGPRILRAETAAITAIAAVQILIGDFNSKPRLTSLE